VARDDQPRTTGERQLHKQHLKYQPKGHNGGPRHQQHEQRKAPPRAAPEQLGAVASTGNMASPERVSQGLGKAQTAAQRKQERYRLRRPPRTAPEPSQRAPEMDNKKWLAAFLEGQGIKGGKRTRMVAGILMRLESTHQPAPELESSVPAVTVGVLRAERPKDESQWRCRVPTCVQSCHALVCCPLFL